MWSGLTARSMIHGGLASFPPAPPPPPPPPPSPPSQSLFRLGLTLNLAGSRSLAQQHASSAVPLPTTQLQCRMNPHRRLQEKGRLQRQFGLLNLITCCAVNEPRSSAMEEAEAGGRGGVAGDGWISESEVNGPLLLRDQESGGGGGGGPMLDTASAAAEAGASPSSRELWNARAEDGIERVCIPKP
jgi:hypothetical protein